MDDKFLRHHKTIRALRAGAEALQMWVALRSYVANNETDGEIPNEDIDDLPGAPKNPRKWLSVLVECGKPIDGGRGAGLVDPIPTGWKLHNYEKRGLTREQIETAREKARTRKEHWKERQSGTQPERRSERVPNDTGTSPRVRAPAGALPSSPIPSHPTEGTDRARNVQPVISAGRRQELSLQQASPEDVEVFEAWRERFNMPDAHFTADRALPLEQRRTEDMTQQDALDALVGAETDEWFTRQGHKLRLVFCDRERFETYRNIGRDIRAGRPPPPKSGVMKNAAPRQPDSGYRPSRYATEIK